MAEVGLIWERRLQEAAVQYVEMSGDEPAAREAAHARLRQAALEFALANYRPRAPRMHEAGAASLRDRLGLKDSGTGAELRTIADWFNERVEADG